MRQSLPGPPALPRPSSQAAWHAAGTELRDPCTMTPMATWAQQTESPGVGKGWEEVW